MRIVLVGDAATILVGVAAVVSAIGGGVIAPILAFLARKHALGAKKTAKVTEMQIRDASARVDAIAEHLVDSQRQGREVGRELIEVMRDLKRRNGP